MPTTKAAYWQDMKDRAAANIARVSEWGKPSDEQSVKDHLAHVIRHGNCHEKAEVMVEAFEFMLACHMLKTHTIPA